MKRKPKLKIQDDPRWKEYDLLKKQNKIIEVNKLKYVILNSNKWKKPCHSRQNNIKNELFNR